MTAYCFKCGGFDCQCSNAKACSLCGGSRSGLFHTCSSLTTYDFRALELPKLDLSIPKYEPPKLDFTIPKYEPPVVLRNRELEEPSQVRRDTVCGSCYGAGRYPSCYSCGRRSLIGDPMGYANPGPLPMSGFGY